MALVIILMHDAYETDETIQHEIHVHMKCK